MTRSSKPGKQRVGQRDASMHVRRKRMRARLISEDPELQSIRRVTIRVGDEVEVIRGDFGHPNSVKSDTRGKRLGQSRGRAGVSGKIAKVDTNTLPTSSLPNCSREIHSGSRGFLRGLEVRWNE